MVRVADYIIDAIQKAGAAHVFLVTGRGILQLTDAVAKNPDIQGISTLHEQGASYAAMAYAKARQGVGACLVSTGCAATNAVTGCLCAYQDNLPVVFISGQHSLNETVRFTGAKIRTFGSQEADIISIVQSITKYAIMITDPSRTVYEVEKAIHLANHGRKGPVWIDVPLDIQGMRIEPEQLEHYIISQGDTNSLVLDENKVRETIQMLGQAKRPLLMLGGGCHGCEGLIKKLVERLRLPVIYTYSGCDIYGSGHPLSIGAVNSLGAPRAGNFAFQNADCIIVVGSRLCSQSIGADPSKVAREAKVIVVDIDEAEHMKKGMHIDLYISAYASEFFQELDKHLDILDCEAWITQCLHWKDIFAIEREEFITSDTENGRIDLYELAGRLSECLPKDSSIITDAGLEELIIPPTIRFYQGQYCFFPASQGAMGYAIPAIIGAYYGGCQKLAVVVGDGSIMMNIQELQLLQYHAIPVKILVINNHMYSVIRSRQKDMFRTRTIGNDPEDGVPEPDFASIANAFGLAYQKIINRDELDGGLATLFQEKGSVLCEVYCKTEQKYFHTSFRKNQKGKIVRPSLEDQSPFMDRELFQEEMIVDIIDD